MSLPHKAKLGRLDNKLQRVVAELEVQFNPTELTLSKGVQLSEIAIPGLDMPLLQFVRGQTETLSLDLLFDSTEGGSGEGAIAVTDGEHGTDRFYQLVKIDPETHAPPVCLFSWSHTGFPGSSFTDQWASQNRENSFMCVVDSVRQRFTLFSTQGVPLRATLTVSLREYRTLQDQVTKIGFRSPTHTRVRVVQYGDTLSRIADEAYDDAGTWRPIADFNGIANPLDLQPGTILEIPPLE